MSTVVIFPCGSIIYWYTLFNFVLHCNMHVKVKSNSPFLKVETKHLAQISPVKSGQFYQFGNAGTFCLGKKPAWCYQYWVVFLWKLLNPDYCSRCLVLPEKKVLVDKNESSESEYMFQYDFFFLYFNQKWKCYFLMSFKIYNTVFKYRHSLSMEAANLNKWTKWSFVLRLDLQFKTSGLVLMSYDF